MIWCRLRPLKELIFPPKPLIKAYTIFPSFSKLRRNLLEEKKNLQSLFKKGHNFKKIINGKPLPLSGDKVFWTIGAGEIT